MMLNLDRRKETDMETESIHAHHTTKTPRERGGGGGVRDGGQGEKYRRSYGRNRRGRAGPHEEDDDLGYGTEVQEENASQEVYG